MSSLTNADLSGVLGNMNLNKEQFNSPKKNSSLMAHLESLVDAESKTQNNMGQKQNKEAICLK